jgi:hypothetical protein
MSLLDKASLIVTPNAYKESKLYSVVPSSGAGDMDVVRATTATRVNSSGLIEVVPRNLLTYSEQFDNAAWTKASTTITSNSAVAPNGTNTADKIECSTNLPSTSFIRQALTVGNGSKNTFSIYIKPITDTSLRIDEAAYTGKNITFNLSTGNITTTGGPFSNFSIITLANGWFQCVFTFQYNAGQDFWYFNINNQSAFIWGAQLEQGSTATEYFPTTTRLNIPRIDYTNGSCPSLLVEPQRTNIILNSQNFTAATWAPVATTITANAGISPDGTNNANKFIPSTLATSHYISQFFISSTNGSISIYAKADGYNNITLLTSNANVNYNLSTGTVQDVGGVGTGAIQSVGNGWYRCILYKVLTTETLYISCGSNTNAGFFNGSGNGTSGVLIWGGQIEVGAYQTSYIPTVASTVTRNADVISKTGISSLIGQTEGTVFIKADNKILGQTNRTLFYVSDATANNYITLNYSAAQADTIRFFVVGNAALAALGFFVYTAPILKLAVTYKNGVYKLFINGSLIYTQTGNAFNANLESLFVGTNRNLNEPIGERIESLQIYKTELTNAECIALTTL